MGAVTGTKGITGSGFQGITAIAMAAGFPDIIIGEADTIPTTPGHIIAIIGSGFQTPTGGNTIE